jgi:hypothetical protein
LTTAFLPHLTPAETLPLVNVDVRRGEVFPQGSDAPSDCPFVKLHHETSAASAGLELPRSNIYSLLEPDFTNETPALLPEDCCYGVNLPGLEDKLFLVAGSASLPALEESDIGGSEGRLAAPAQLVSFRRRVKEVAQAKGCDFVIVDLGPHAGVQNRWVVMSCDLLLPPSFPDRFSESATRGLLSDILPRWHLWQKNWLEAFAARLAARHPPENNLATHQIGKWARTEPPRILPFIVTRVPTNNEGNATKSVGSWILAIERQARNVSLSTEPRLDSVRAAMMRRPVAAGSLRHVAPAMRELDAVLRASIEQQRPIQLLATPNAANGYQVKFTQAHADEASNSLTQLAAFIRDAALKAREEERHAGAPAEGRRQNAYVTPAPSPVKGR